jgi:hypothetical protein
MGDIDKMTIGVGDASHMGFGQMFATTDRSEAMRLSYARNRN